MSVWLWIFVGVAGFFAASLLVGLFLAAILAKLGQEFSGLIDRVRPTGIVAADRPSRFDRQRRRRAPRGGSIHHPTAEVAGAR